MTGLDLDNRQLSMYDDAKSALKKFKGGASSIVKTENKNDFDTFYTSSRRPPH